jgi:cytochrome c556
MAAFKAAQSHNQDRVVEVSETLTNACANCHERYRDTPKEPLDRCI